MVGHLVIQTTKSVGYRVVPTAVYHRARSLARGMRRRSKPLVRMIEGGKTAWRLAWARCRLRRRAPGSTIRCAGFTLRITDGPNAYIQYKDEFVRRIYHFEATRADPLIIDGGSNVGMSICAFKRAHPEARIVGFEPDPAIFRLLQENTEGNGLTDVTLINAALGSQSGRAEFAPDRSAGGCLQAGSEGTTVQVERLSDHLRGPVDFLKLNIEGQELPVLGEAEASGTLGNVREMVVEYHGWPGGEQRLGDILNLLDRNRFRYLIHDFDAETCPASKPPFRHTPRTVWFCLIHALRFDHGDPTRAEENRPTDHVARPA